MPTPIVRTRPRSVREMVAVTVLVGALAFLAVVTGSAVAVAQDPDDAPLSSTEADERVAVIERFVKDVEQDLQGLKSDRLHPDVVLEGLGTDPLAILDWVSSETDWVPYIGVLRSPLGMLMDRSGNSLDRALLLSDLLMRAGLETRLARTSLPDDVAAGVAVRELSRSGMGARDGQIGTDQTAADYRARAATTAAELMQLLPLPTGASDVLSDVATEAMADHWWVQVLLDGDWVDLDPIFGDRPDARPDATSTFELGELPESLRHSVTLRVVIERKEGDGRIEDVAFEQTLGMGSSSPYATLEVSFDSWLGPEAGPEDVDGFGQVVRAALELLAADAALQGAQHVPRVDGAFDGALVAAVQAFEGGTHGALLLLDDLLRRLLSSAHGPRSRSVVRACETAASGTTRNGAISFCLRPKHCKSHGTAALRSASARRAVCTARAGPSPNAVQLVEKAWHVLRMRQQRRACVIGAVCTGTHLLHQTRAYRV